jgi:amino acid efflux transporter
MLKLKMKVFFQYYQFTEKNKIFHLDFRRFILKAIHKKPIGLPQAIALYISAVLGAGVLFAPGLVASIAGPASLVSWGIMCILAMPLALVMGLLSANFPHIGGVSHFITVAYGQKFGSLTGWFFLMSVAIMVPVMALTGAGYLCQAMGWSEPINIIIAILILLFSVFMNLLGMKITGKVQIILVLVILYILLIMITRSVESVESIHFTPFMPNGWVSVGQSMVILFWCFTGWEAVCNLSGEFHNPKKMTIKAVVISAVTIGIFYFMIAFSTVGTASYLSGDSHAALSILMEKSYGKLGVFILGVVAVLICTATSITYIGGASRIAYSLAKNGYAPQWIGRVSSKYGTHSGGLLYLLLCFFVVLFLYKFEIMSLFQLVKIPNATLILTYLGGCLAGAKLFSDQKQVKTMSILSCSILIVLLVFAGWTVIYPLLILLGVWNFKWRKSKEGKEQLVFHD